MSNEKYMLAGGGLVAGIFVGLGIGGALVTDKINAAVGNALAPVQEMVDTSGTEDAIAALGARLDALETQLSESAGRTSEISDAARSQLESIQSALAGRIDEIVAATNEQAGELRAALEGMMMSRQGGMDGHRGMMKGGARAVEPPEDLPAGDTVPVGGTAMFADGAVRAFVSRVDAQTETVRLSVNGTLVTVGVGQAIPVALDSGDCAVVVQGISGGGAVLSSDCGGAPAASADVPAAPETGFRPGEVAMLADGALRVFVSGLAADGSSARIAINGVETQMVPAGSTVASGDCEVTVTGVGGGLVGLEGSCG